ncbi:hypothetical protein V6N12_023447 [Hibiscus sabdariffa]|uniref:Uncharacterized protein n=1 Tax=Hibiscus sabdariffa TaxID=183260 RepID=A0ABR2FXQ5_9ROSI
MECLSSDMEVHTAVSDTFCSTVRILEGLAVYRILKHGTGVEFSSTVVNFTDFVSSGVGCPHGAYVL